MSEPQRAITVGVVGIDGSGKSSVIRRLCELGSTRFAIPGGGFAPGKIVPWTCPAYHETPNLPFAELSRSLAVLSKLGDELQSSDLKVAAMTLQMTLYGPIERFLKDAYAPRLLISEHHALIDTLAYGVFYQGRVRSEVDPTIEGRVRERLGGDAGVLEAALAWHASEQRRRGVTWPFWATGQQIVSILSRPESERLDELARWYRCDFPDVLVVLDVSVDTALARLAHRGDATRELHESGRVLEALRGAYRAIGAALVARGTTRVHVVDTSASDVDATLDAILDHVGAAA